MAYVKCARCGRPAFTMAYWSNVDYCDRCGAELPHPRSVSQRLMRRPQSQNAHLSPASRWMPPSDETRSAA